MPIIKHSAIHVTPLKAIEYVINGDKTDNCKYVTGINVSTSAKEAYEDFRINFEMHTGERFFKAALPQNGKKEKIRLHHYIQSFKPGEVTPELAHKIAEEWVWAMFQKKWNVNYQVLICTHVDCGHIHNHILVSVVDLDGKAWHDNKETLKKARDESDKIAKKYNLSVIENLKKGTMLPYTEYIARQNNNSWKDKLKSQIDILVLQPDVKNIHDLAEKLKTLGYEISGRKYMHIKRAKDKNRKPMSTLKLGDGYGLEELQNRIEMKNVIIPLSKVNSYSGIQREYAFCLRQTQLLLYRKKKSDYEVSYGTLRKNCDLLWYLHDNNIHSVSEFENAVNSADEKFRKLSEKKKELEEKIRNGYEDVRAELDGEIEKAKSNRKKAAECYKTYLRQMETDYDRMLREMKELYNFNADAITETFAGELNEMHYLAEIYKGTVTEKTFVDYDRLDRDFEMKNNIQNVQPTNNRRTYGVGR